MNSLESNRRGPFSDVEPSISGNATDVEDHERVIAYIKNQSVAERPCHSVLQHLIDKAIEYFKSRREDDVNDDEYGKIDQVFRMLGKFLQMKPSFLQHHSVVTTTILERKDYHSNDKIAIENCLSSSRIQEKQPVTNYLAPANQKESTVKQLPTETPLSSSLHNTKSLLVNHSSNKFIDSSSSHSNISQREGDLKKLSNSLNEIRSTIDSIRTIEKSRVVNDRIDSLWASMKKSDPSSSSKSTPISGHQRNLNPLLKSASNSQSSPTKSEMIQQIDIHTKKVLKTFHSIEEAVNAVQGKAPMIILCCEGKISQAHGYNWKKLDMNPVKKSPSSKFNYLYRMSVFRSEKKTRISFFSLTMFYKQTSKTRKFRQ
jgi:hypothetical protein